MESAGPALIPSSPQAFDDFIFAFFAVEMVIKMVALGLFGQKCYLGDTWNRLDFFIVMAGYSSPRPRPAPPHPGPERPERPLARPRLAGNPNPDRRSPRKRREPGAPWRGSGAAWSEVRSQRGLCQGWRLSWDAQEGEECPAVTQSRAPPASGSSLAGLTAWGPALQRAVTCPPPEPPSPCLPPA